MMHHGVYTSPFPIHLLFADACLVSLPSHVGLNLSGVLVPGCPRYPTVVDWFYSYPLIEFYAL